MIPHFDKIMNLIGGSTMTLLTFIFPPLFYIFLNYNDDSKLRPHKRYIYFLLGSFQCYLLTQWLITSIIHTYYYYYYFCRISCLEMIFLLQIILIGIAGGIACTYFTMIDIVQFPEAEKKYRHWYVKQKMQEHFSKLKGETGCFKRSYKIKIIERWNILQSCWIYVIHTLLHNDM